MASPSIPVQAKPHRAAARGLLALTLFCLGHFFVDFYSGSLGVLQPLLLERFGLSFTQAGILGGVLVFSSSVMQPAYGYLSDRFHSRLFTVLAPAVAAVFMTTLAWAPGYWGLLVMVTLGGAGVASFHPQGAANAVAGVKANRAQAMAVFVCAGSLGMAVAPVIFSALTAKRGLEGAAWAVLPGLLMATAMLAFVPPPVRLPHAKRGFDWEPLRAVWKPMTILYMLVFLRSIVQIVFAQFLPLYLHTHRGHTLAAASLSLTLYQLGGTLGGFAGGHLADRFGGRRVILYSMIGSVPFLMLFLFTTGASSTVGLFLSGLVLLFTIPVNVVMAQELAPTQAGTVSALMMGFAWGMAGLVFIPLTGWVSDLFSMQAAFSAMIVFPVIGWLLALKLPK